MRPVTGAEAQPERTRSSSVRPGQSACNATMSRQRPRNPVNRHDRIVGQYDVRLVVPPAKTASVSRRRPRSGARDRTITRVKRLGRRRWKKASGYQRQARVENAVFRYKSIIGDGLRARTPGGRQTETLLACNVLNRMTELGRPASYSIGR